MTIVAKGREEKIYVVAEATFGTAASAPAATDAMRFRDCSFTKTEERVNREDKRNTRSYMETIVRRVNANWSISGYLLPSGAAGTAPDGWDELLKAAFGTQTINASTSVVYSLAKEFTNSVTLHRAIGNGLANAVAAEMFTGCVPTQVEFNLSGQDEAMISMSGFAVDSYRAGVSASTGDTGTVVSITAGTGQRFDIGAYVDLGAAITAKVITAGGGTTDSLTVAAHAAVSNATAVVPTACQLAQTFVATAKPISGILGSCTLEGSAIEIISANIKINNNSKALNDKFGSNKTQDFFHGNRMVDGQITVRLTDATFSTLAKTRRSTNVALTIVAGTTAGSIATFSLPTVMLQYAAMPSVASDDIVVTLPFIAYGSSGEDEITLTLT